VNFSLEPANGLFFFHYGHTGATVSQCIFQRNLFEDEIRLYMLVIVVNLLLCWVEISVDLPFFSSGCFEALRFILTSAVTKTIAIKSNIRMACTSEIAFLHCLEASIKSICANLFGVQGPTKPFVLVSLYVHLHSSGFMKNVLDTMCSLAVQKIKIK